MNNNKKNSGTKTVTALSVKWGSGFSVKKDYYVTSLFSLGQM